jgi:hypothetical protein
MATLTLQVTEVLFDFDDEDFTPEDVYSIRNKIHALFDYND